MGFDKDSFFREATLRISSSLNIDEALTSTFDYLRQFMPVDTMGLNYVDTDRKCIFPVATVAREGSVSLWDDSPPGIPVDDEFLYLMKEHRKTGSLVRIFNRPEFLPEPALRCFPHLASCSTIVLSLNIRGEPVGHISLSATGHDRYTEEHSELLESVKDPIALAMSNARRHMELENMKNLLADDNRALQADIERISGTEVIGADFGLREVMEMVRRVAPSNSPALLLGETGAGKEVIANAIHMASPRRDGPMVRMQCGAIPETLLDSELFGHEKGAFTGAIERKRGRFERADGGTVFLDEIAELSAEAQVKLLRVLQEKCFERVGGTKTITVNVRVIAATHRDLEHMVNAGKFREDLWYRLNVLPVRIPPLRLRRDDIPSLARYFINRKASEMNLGAIPSLGNDSLQRLIDYEWPGNVRELQNVVERSLILSHGDRLVIPELSHTLSQNKHAPAVPVTPLSTMDQAIATHIRLALEHTNGQVAGPGGAAELLKIHPSTLRFRMKKLKISLSPGRRTVV